MKDITDYFHISNKNVSLQTPDPIPKCRIPLFGGKSKNHHNSKKEKRKIETTSESEEETATNKPRSKQKRMSPYENDLKEEPLFTDNVSIRLTNIDQHLIKMKKTQTHQKNGANKELCVLLEDCATFIDMKKLKEGKSIKLGDVKSKIVDLSPKKKLIKMKRRPAILDSSSSEDADSEDQLFKEVSKSNKTLNGWSCKTSLNPTRNNDNSSFNYFKKNEKKTQVDDSPVKPPQLIKVIAQIHSPPKPLFKKHKLNDAVKENQSPIVKIIRTDTSKLHKHDEIEVVCTEIVDLEQSLQPCGNESKTDDTDSSDNFLSVCENTLQPWKMRVQFTSSSSKHKKIVKKHKSKDGAKNVTKEPKESKKLSKMGEPSRSSADSEDSETEMIVSSEISQVGPESFADAETDEAQNLSKTNHKKINGSPSSSKRSKIKIWSPRSANKHTQKKSTNDAKDKTKVNSRSPKASKTKTNDQLPKSEPKRTSGNTNHAKDRTIRSSGSPKASKNRTNEHSTKTEPRKLAPLFYRRTDVKKKSSTVAIDDEARRLFLESGVPDAIKKKMEKQKSATQTNADAGEYTFPSKTHIQQKDTHCFVWNLKEIPDLRIKSEDEFVSLPKGDNFSLLINKEESLSINSYECSNLDVKDELALLKKLEPNVNVADIFSSIKKLNKEAKNCDATMCWTDKYKPISSEDVVGNTTSLLKLKEWIESHKCLRFRSTEAGDSSSEEFVDSDDSCSESIRNNLAILVGPSGCGKTCSVYALANELGFKVLEVNAASNRNGKRILDELLEATQSHRVKRTSIFDKAEAKKSRKKKKEDKRDKKTMSLILIEDADILFEKYDEGFQSALSSLTSQSKRPLIFTMNNINYPHLAKYNNSRNLILKFTYPPRPLLNVWLQLVALIEGVKLTDEVFMDLFNEAGLDFRKSLLQLQMLISTKRCYSKRNAEHLFYTNWWKRMPRLEAVFNENRMKCKQRRLKIFSDDEESSADESIQQVCEETPLRERSESENEASVKSLQKGSTLLERIAFLDNLRRNTTHQNFVFPGEENSVERSTLNNYHSELNNDIAEYIANQIFLEKDMDSSFSFKDCYNKIRKTKEVKDLCENVFCGFIPRPASSTSKYCDYLWAIREIARSDRSKMSGSTQRTIRYFSYLKSVNINVSDAEARILCKSLI